jgi:hypothetical protein
MNKFTMGRREKKGRGGKGKMRKKERKRKII